MEAIRRVLILAAASIACALVTGLVALWAHGKSLPPSDLAYGMSVAESLGDPAVMGVWLILVIAAAFLGFVIALPILWKVRLDVAVPLILVTTVPTAAGFAFLFWPASPIFALLAGAGAMISCRSVSEWTLDEAQRASS